MTDLTGKRALVTGASRGTGFAIAKAFAAAGAEVVVSARSRERLELLREEIEAAGGKAVVIAGDLSTREGAREVAELAGDVDILVNNAANTSGKFPSSLGADDVSWDYEFALNLVGPATLMQSLVPGMAERGRGTVINISSIAAARPDPMRAVYASSKAALETFSKAAAIEFAPRGVSINCVALGVTNTEALQDEMVEGITVEMIGQMVVPMGRVTEVSEVAAVCMILASDDAKALTGTVLTIDGAVTAGTFMPGANNVVGFGE